jgi:hypothetical protein
VGHEMLASCATTLLALIELCSPMHSPRPMQLLVARFKDRSPSPGATAGAPKNHKARVCLSSTCAPPHAAFPLAPQTPHSLCPNTLPEYVITGAWSNDSW